MASPTQSKKEHLVGAAEPSVRAVLPVGTILLHKHWLLHIAFNQGFLF